MLESLSGCGHEVHTAVSLWLVSALKGEDVGLVYRTFVDTTYVYFKELAPHDIEAYIESGDPFDKAGAYGIQSGASAFVDHIEGSLDTVIGMPVTRLLDEFPDVFSV
jgi:septum formation protein